MSICQATRSEPASVELPSQSPDGPYQLSDGAATRLQALALRPLEWYHLASLHGPFEYYLHDDFYSEEGEACQPKQEVLDSELYPCPTLEESSDDLQSLLDYAGTRWFIEQPVIDEFRPYADELLDAVRERFERTRNPWFHERLAEIAAQVVGQQAAVWFAEVLDRFEPKRQVPLLHAGHKCLPREQGLATAMTTLSHLDPVTAAQHCMLLAHFRDSSVLDWIERHVRDPITGQWGDLAAASSFAWDRALKWLQSGRPLSLVALDAMIACGGPRPNQSALMRELHPRMRADAPPESILAAIADYRQRDPSPRVSKSAEYIASLLPVILATD
ncbi:MAG: hypothetical protein H6818_21235 [Phycisphaerales bacterium]|nr:hypothetical protein [Phycisphaerales bacterium]MCB9862317.1 hypothetical protein [Phycisphaerales bacterium]